MNTFSLEHQKKENENAKFNYVINKHVLCLSNGDRRKY